MKKILWFISILCMILGVVTGCSSKGDTGISVTRNVAEKDQQKGSEKKQNKKEEDSYEAAASVPVKKKSLRVNCSNQNWSSRQ
ncbi:hypothetical protein [Bacillus toyonensis]|uniref:hypothetical protein n=1 Tax=Bacillus toyonensis TaxID=155322 RepID=UPI000BF1056A|nr:hypothetical protein [Bacillus toyonensis]PEK14241.1 hypothetical protein CN681_01265 [Bacillus toyonensis]PEM16462.1 hypothetical protein CN616_19320 [Bacillus toyonensis]PGA02934.1 hypothetical protein COL67_26635 [Bacillus toyonensis]PGA45577.1 hypothetical protein COL85_12830 [Bacillus toyonensis]PGA51035.1 hypothetical protein COL86_28215 [Bacillus toyonensis]